MNHILEDILKEKKPQVNLHKLDFAAPFSPEGFDHFLTTLVPLLHDYIYLAYEGNIDHAIYNQEVHSPTDEFSKMEIVRRQGTTWSIPTPDGSVFIVRPVQRVEELTDFIDSPPVRYLEEG